MSEESIKSLMLLVVIAAMLVPLLMILLHECGVTLRWPWQHPDDCPCGALERKRRIAEVRKAIEELERERRGR